MPSPIKGEAFEKRATEFPPPRWGRVRARVLHRPLPCSPWIVPFAMRFRLTPEILLKAYMAGIFPMAESADDPELFWVDPERRGVLPLDGFHIPRRLRRVVRQG